MKTLDELAAKCRIPLTWESSIGRPSHGHTTDRRTALAFRRQGACVRRDVRRDQDGRRVTDYGWTLDAA